ncbi:class I SAM-dependent methyltransferase [Celeribacter sp.]|uniref:class I SAM-dependent methyltransferase n=1 Tax=Celeribacter sp. TaxID=1890673 RepID=UPI003A8F7E74
MKQFKVDELMEWTPPMPDRYREGYLLGAYPEDRLRKVMWKYLLREPNMRRAWVRINAHLPETLVNSERLSILEFSTAHGAMLEVWRDHGHHVRGTDFNWAKGQEPLPLDRPWKARAIEDLREITSPSPPRAEIDGWAYQPLIESQGLEVDMVDGREWPYPYEDKSFDVVCCYQAIEAYAHPSKWIEIAREFCRIARKTVVIGFNPPAVSKFEEDFDAARAAWLDFQRFDEMGFRVDFFEVGNTRRGVHPTACKLVAIN